MSSAPDEPVAFNFQSEDPMAEVSAVLTRADTGQEVTRVALGAGSGWRTTEISPLQPGSYRLTLVGRGEVEPVTDAFVVLDTAEPVQTTVRSP